MNIRKAVDYSTMFATLESVMKADLPQMELYCEIGKAVCAHSEKGAAVAAAEFIKEQYPDMTGFSPRNVRRMRDFWQLYSGTPELLGEALHLNWTQNVVIMEAELPAEERRWYIRQATARNLSKAELLRMIEDSAYLESVLDEKVDVWYNEGNDEISERTQYEEDPVYLSWQYLPLPNNKSIASQSAAEQIVLHLLGTMNSIGMINAAGYHSAAVTLMRSIEDALDCLFAVVQSDVNANKWLNDELKASQAARTWTADKVVDQSSAASTHEHQVFVILFRGDLI